MSFFENYKFNYGHSFLASAFGAAAGAAALTTAAPALGVAFGAAAGGIIGSAVTRAIYRGLFHEGESYGGGMMDEISSGGPQSTFGWMVWGDEYMAGAAIVMVLGAAAYGALGPLYDAGMYVHDKVTTSNTPKPKF